MKQELKKLKEKKLKKTGEKIIDGFILEYGNTDMEAEEFKEDLEIHFNTEQTNDGYEIFCYKYKDENGSELCPFDKYQEGDAELIKKGRKVFKQYLQDELHYKE